MGIPQKGIVGSNPILSATFVKPLLIRAYVIVLIPRGRTMTKNYDQTPAKSTGGQGTLFCVSISQRGVVARALQGTFKPIR